MLKKLNSQEWQKKVWPNLAILFFLTGLTVFVNYNTRIVGLYQDDLYVWDQYISDRPFDYIFLTGTSRFRVLWNLLSFLLFKGIGQHTEWLVPINMVLGGMIAMMVSVISCRFSGSRTIGCLMGVAYVLSRFSYYQISMVLGIMEAAGLTCAILLLYFLFQYCNAAGKERRYGSAAILCYFLMVFAHERYMVLILLILPVFFIKKNIRYTIYSLLTFLLVQLIRFWAIGTILPPGTGHTTVAETFTLSQGLRFAVSQVLYIFGINAGPEHLNGIPWSDSAVWIKLLVSLSIVLLVLYCLLVVRVLVLEKKDRKQILCNIALFSGFIALCIGSSSVTVRVEMRWVYVSYTAALCFFAYLYGVIGDKRRDYGKQVMLGTLLVFGYVALLVPIEGYYRGCRDQMYYYDGQKKMNSLVEETYGKYGDALFEKNLYVLNNEFEIADYTWRTVFRIFHPKNLHALPPVQVISDVNDLGLITEDMLILSEDKSDKTYVNITEYVKRQKLNRLIGYYEDGWVDRHSEFEVQLGSTGKLSFRFYFPGILKGGERAVVKIEGQREIEIPMSENFIVKEIVGKPYEMLHVSIDCNFYMEDAAEQRSSDHMAMVVNLTAD